MVQRHIVDKKDPGEEQKIVEKKDLGEEQKILDKKDPEEKNAEGQILACLSLLLVVRSQRAV